MFKKICYKKITTELRSGQQINCDPSQAMSGSFQRPSTTLELDIGLRKSREQRATRKGLYFCVTFRLKEHTSH